MMKVNLKLVLVCVLITVYFTGIAQDSSRIFFTTAAGLIKSPGSLGKVLQPSFAFNSGIEIVSGKNWFALGTVDFNALRYNQRLKDGGSPYLFQNTTSSLVMIAINGGKNFRIGHDKWFASMYTGGGYLNIGEPRLLEQDENIIRQAIRRKGGVFGKLGTRLGYRTKIKFLQTIYFDGSWWKSSSEIQGSELNGISIFLGLRMSMK